MKPIVLLAGLLGIVVATAFLVVQDNGRRDEMSSLKQQLKQKDKEIAELKVNIGKPISVTQLPPATGWIRSDNKQVVTVLMDGDDQLDLPGPYYAVFSKDGEIPDRFTIEDGKVVKSRGVIISDPLSEKKPDEDMIIRRPGKDIVNPGLSK